MPKGNKNKTHSGTKKRVRLTGTKRLRRERARKRHLLEHKTATSKLAKRGTTEIAPADQKRVRELLGS